MSLPELLVHFQLIPHLIALPVMLLVLSGDQILRANGSKPVIVFTMLLQLKGEGKKMSILSDQDTEYSN